MALAVDFTAAGAAISLLLFQVPTDCIAVCFFVCILQMEPNPERAAAVKKKPTAWLFQADAVKAVLSRNSSLFTIHS